MQRELFARETAHERASQLMRAMGCTAPTRSRYGDWEAWARTAERTTCFYGAENLTRIVRQARWLTGRGPFPEYNAREFGA
jgi:hypothetical protein